MMGVHDIPEGATMSLPTHRINQFDAWLEAQGHRFGPANVQSAYAVAHYRRRHAALALIRKHPTALPLDAMRWYWGKAQDAYWATIYAPTNEQVMDALRDWERSSGQTG